MFGLKQIIEISDADFAWAVIKANRKHRKETEMSLAKALAEFDKPVNPRPIRKRKLMIDDDCLETYLAEDSDCLPKEVRN